VGDNRTPADDFNVVNLIPVLNQQLPPLNEQPAISSVNEVLVVSISTVMLFNVKEIQRSVTH
jgi:hypothetical protein